jgi:hypothetical protein
VMAGVGGVGRAEGERAWVAAEAGAPNK